MRSAQTPLAHSLDALMPHGDRDHFVYLWQKVVDGKRVAEGIQVEHVTRRGESDEFEVVLSEDGVPALRARMRDDGQALELIEEDDLSQEVRMVFSPPLRQYEIPLVAGERVMHSTVKLISLVGETPITAAEVSQAVRLAGARKIRSAVGNYETGIGVEMRRTLHWPWGDVSFASSMMIVPGIGEIRSETTYDEGFALRRELACAIIRGRPVGNCADVEDRLREIRDAGSSDVR